MKQKKFPKIGLALGSGGAKGLSHIGVIKELEKNNIPIFCIAGSSIGSLIGGAYATKRDIYGMEKEVLGTNWKKIFSLIDPVFNEGLIGGNKVKEFIEEYTQKKKFEELEVKFSVVATEFREGKAVIIDKGDVATAIRASISFPLLFEPVRVRGKVLSDGGLTIPVPVNVAKEMGAEIVIAVNLDGDYFNKEKNHRKINLYQAANTSLNILRHHLALSNVREADMVISPEIGDVKWSKFADGKDVVLSGEEAMRKKIRKLREIIKKI